MSDCSTNAMKRKKRPEVCPRCEHSMTEHPSEYEPSLVHLHCDNCGCSITRERKEQSKTGFETEYDIQPFCESCEHNLGYLMQARVSADASASYVELEQRHQQLEQVAKDMLLWFREMRSVFNGEKSHEDVSLPKDARNFKKRLEELGVSLDD